MIELTDKFEKDESWKESIDKGLLSSLSSAIIGIKIEVKEIFPKFKLSQNKELEERDHIIKRLHSINPRLSSDMSKYSNFKAD